MSLTIPEALEEFFKSATYPIIFTGAGISVRTGLPTWKDLIINLAEGLREKDPLTTQQMLECVRDGDYTIAADYFNISRKMLDGDKRRLLKSLLTNYDISSILPIAKLPFRGCLTTNFDRSILDSIAHARKTSALDFKYGDSSFKQAQWEENLFVARIHGAAEVPESIILSEAQFSRLLSDDTYNDLLRTCFVNRNVLFVGFSFYDPAIRSVFDDLDKRFGPASPGRHLAILPSNANNEFIQKANRLNIEVITYDSSDHHAALWKGFDDFNNKPTSDATKDSQIKTTPFGSTKHYLAACYARAKTQDSSTALREAVLEGIVSAILQEALPNAISRTDLLDKIRIALGLKGRDAEEILNRSTNSLRDADLCVRSKNEAGKGYTYKWKGSASTDDSLDFAIKTLAENLESRAFLQEGWKISQSINEKIISIFNHLIKRRGWDLGAAFAAGRPPEAIAVESVFNECSLDIPAYDRERLLRVFTSMLTHPSADESKLLGELGRISFALEMAFHSPQRTLLHHAVLPRSIYFDASVLLPALVAGHPYSKVYIDAINRLKEASSSAAIDLKLKVCAVYLNEIISHRRMAVAYSEEAGADFLGISRSDALYHGMSNMNVFVGAYANWTSQNAEITFNEFLSRFAPYTNEAQLRTWLSNNGFQIISAHKNEKYPTYYSTLERAYASSITNGKKPLLIEHDAIQLSILDSDLSKGEKSLFVTADRQLQQIASKSKNSAIAEMMISHVGLVQFIELILGGVSESAGFTELLWSARVSSKAQAVRSHFVNISLSQYDEVIAMTMPDIIEQFSTIAVKELDRSGDDLDAEDPKKRAKAFRALGLLEKGYLTNMHQAVQKLHDRLNN